MNWNVSLEVVAGQDEVGRLEAAVGYVDEPEWGSAIEADYYAAVEVGCMDSWVHTMVRCVMIVGSTVVVIGRKVVGPPAAPELDVLLGMRWRLAAISGALETV